MSSRHIVADEFLKAEWRTYAMVELQEDDDDVSPEEVEQRLDSLTRLLYPGNAQDKEIAAQLLGKWLRKPANASRPRWLGFKLRRILCLQQLRHAQPAVDELDSLLEKGPYAELASLRCLRGNLLGWLDKSRWDEAIVEFDRAIGLAPTWVEPHLEKIEKLILLGRYLAAIDNIDAYIARIGNNQRARLVLLVNRVVARVLSDRSYGGSAECRKDIGDTDGIVIPLWQREGWNLKVVREQLLSSDIPKDITIPLSDWLVTVERRVDSEPQVGHHPP